MASPWQERYGNPYPQQTYSPYLPNPHPAYDQFGQRIVAPQFTRAQGNEMAMAAHQADPNRIRGLLFNAMTGAGMEPGTADFWSAPAAFMPVVGDAMDAEDAYQSMRAGDYLGAGIAGGAAVLPWITAAGLGAASRRGLKKMAKKGGDVVFRRTTPTSIDALVGERQVGHLGMDDAKRFITSVTVDEAFRGKGIGRELYRLADELATDALIPSPLGLTPDATKIWKRRLAQMSSNEANALIDKSMEIGRGYGISDVHLSERLDPLRPQSAKPPIRAYHGSPHDFDEFRMDKIGTGEGNG